MTKRVILAAAAASFVLATVNTASADPIKGPDKSKLYPECRVIRMSDGTTFQTGGNVVKLGGKCPANYVPGRIVDAYTVKLGDGRTCRVNESGRGSCL